jgi:hypothetical protein
MAEFRSRLASSAFPISHIQMGSANVIIIITQIYDTNSNTNRQEINIVCGHGNADSLCYACAQRVADKLAFVLMRALQE